MCGIVGYIGYKKAKDVILDGLKHLEYRGYDSSGIALLEEGKIEIVRAVGKLSNLMERLKEKSYSSTVGIGHTRWATHGKPSEENAHPHMSKDIAIVHNGIIENYVELKEELLAKGYQFTSETDTEVIAHILTENYSNNLIDAVQKAMKRLKGSYAVALISQREPEKVVAFRKDSPLVVGIGEGENFVASDIPALLPYTRSFIFLEDGDIAVLTRESVAIYDERGKRIQRDVHHIDWNPVMAERAGYRHFMEKEVHEQPRALTDTMRGRINLERGEIHMEGLLDLTRHLRDVDHIILSACGTSWHASLIGKLFLERFARITTSSEIASELRYREPVLGTHTLLVSISQSGETADTIRAHRMIRKKGTKAITICNVPGSTLSRETDGIIYTHAGPEIGVASTKAFTTQIMALLLFSLHMGRLRGVLSKEKVKEILSHLVKVPEIVREALKKQEKIRDMAKRYKNYKNFLYLGRGFHYPIALEGALKLKEISYIHAEGYPGGEMKHGPIALIDRNFPVFVISTYGDVYEKTIGNIEEIRARDGIVISIVTEGDERVKKISNETIEIPEVPEFLSIFPESVIFQLFAYHVATLLGLDVDQPRNLAKSVTVE